MMIRTLMLCDSAGFEHSYLPNAEVALKEIARDTAMLAVRTTRQSRFVTRENLEKFDVLVFATTGELPMDEEQKQAILDFVRGGKGFVGIHNATDTFYKWEEYGVMLGGYFNGHPWNQEATVKVEDPDHPCTRHLPASFRVADEWYTFKNWSREKTHVLMSLDNDSVDVSKGKRDDDDYAVAWCHDYGEGRVIYTALGHPDELWSRPWFRRHVLGCITWAARVEE